jgi:hypothetical protein
MMVGVALTAIGLAAFPYLRISPVPTLTAAALVASILAVAHRGHDRRLLRVALVLFLAAGLCRCIQESISLWQLSARYQRLAQHHTLQARFTRCMVSAFDQNPKSFRSSKAWQEERPGWLRYIDKSGELVSRYSRAAAQPWHSLEAMPDTTE